MSIFLGGVFLYYARIRFDIINKTFINYNEKSHLLFSEGGCSCNLVGSNNCIRSSDKLRLEYGGFATYDEAFNRSLPLIDELKLYCVKRGIAIKIAGDVGETDSINVSTPTGGITNEGKKFFGLPQNLKHEVLGLGIYEVENNLSEITFISVNCSPSLRINNFNLGNDHSKAYGEEARIAISLLNSSNVLIMDSRISFLLKVMAVEALVSTDEKHNKDIVKKIQALQDNKDIISKIDDILKDTTINIKQVLGGLKRKSIRIKTKELVDNLCGDKSYFETTAAAFWDQCYDIRSEFTHTGKIAIKDVHDRQSVLHELVTDLVDAYIVKSNPPLSI